MVPLPELYPDQAIPGFPADVPGTAHRYHDVIVRVLPLIYGWLAGSCEAMVELMLFRTVSVALLILANGFLWRLSLPW